MGVGVMHACGRGRGRSVQIVSLHCDDPTCRVVAYAETREAFAALRALGWSADFAAKTARCPAHSDVVPTVDVQQELLS